MLQFCFDFFDIPKMLPAIASLIASMVYWISNNYNGDT
jgi:hypothetical protein